MNGGGLFWGGFGGAAGEECGERGGSYHRPVQGEPLWIDSAAVGLSYEEAGCVLLVWWQERYIERFSCFGENRRKIHTLHEYGGTDGPGRYY